MGIGVIVAGISVAIGAALAAYAIFASRSGNNEDMEGFNTDDFKPTMVKEGAVVPLVYGRVRLRGNLIAWGNLRTEEIESEEEGGKGSPETPEGSNGYRVYVDAWISVAMGKCNLIDTYINDENEVIDGNLIWNDGTTGDFPTFPGEFANQLNGVAHAIITNWYIGDNVNNIPTIHFVIERELLTGLPFENRSNGSNPAAACYDICLKAGATISELDSVSFSAGCNFYHSKDLAVNTIFDRLQNASKTIEKLQKWFEFILYQSTTGQYIFKPFNSADVSIVQFFRKDIHKFSFNRKDWSQIFNDFHATYIDEAQDFTNRVVNTQNPAAIALSGFKNKQSVDLKCCRDLTTASKMLWELAKKSSYPAGTVTFFSNLKGAIVNPGDVISIDYPPYSITGDFRAISVDKESIEKNEVRIQAVQMLETLFDDYFEESGGTNQTPIDFTPEPAAYFRAFELPATKTLGDSKTILLLVERSATLATGYNLLVSDNPTSNFSSAGKFSSFSVRGLLTANYSSTTFKIDDSSTIAFSIAKDGLDPTFSSISRRELFTNRRVAIIGDEILAFQNINQVGPNDYELTGLIRGLLNTPIQNHNINDEIWLANITINNIYVNPAFDNLYYKVLPFYNSKVVLASLVTAKNLVITNKAKTPNGPGRIVANRSGSTISVQVFPAIEGAGFNEELITDLPPPFIMKDHRLKYTWNSNNLTTPLDSFNITEPAAVSISVSLVSPLGFQSISKSIFVDIANGEYKS
jgi:hypothetical protein